MPYTQRDQAGNICGLYALPQPGYAEEFLSDTDASVVAHLNPPKPRVVLPQDLMAQLTADDATKIRAAVEVNAQFWLLWSAMQAQKDPMAVTSERFLAGWDSLTKILGADRMNAIAVALELEGFN